MIFKSEQALSAFAENLGKSLTAPAVFELVGDVGAGKTTFTRALAKGLGIKEPVTSPSFTISKRYERSADENRDRITLIHYDFYRLSDPGIMAEDLIESLSNDHAVVIVEWANTVANILPKDRITITFKVLPNGSRELSLASGEIDPFCRPPEVTTASEPNQLHSELESSDASSTTSERRTIALYLDTSDFIAKTILEDSGQTFEYKDNLGREMAEKLLETLENHLKAHGKTWQDLEKITFMSGPGSFTGLRIGATIVNTLAHELNIPLYDHKGIKHKIILPNYGRPANISTPKK